MWGASGVVAGGERARAAYHVHATVVYIGRAGGPKRLLGIESVASVAGDRYGVEGR